MFAIFIHCYLESLMVTDIRQNVNSNARDCNNCFWSKSWLFLVDLNKINYDNDYNFFYRLLQCTDHSE